MVTEAIRQGRTKTGIRTQTAIKTPLHREIERKSKRLPPSPEIGVVRQEGICETIILPLRLLVRPHLRRKAEETETAR